jgi:hypothetical protein
VGLGGILVSVAGVAWATMLLPRPTAAPPP